MPGLLALALVVAVATVTSLQRPAAPAGAPTGPVAATAGTARAEGSLAKPAGRSLDPRLVRATAPGGTELYGYLPYWEMTASFADYLRNVPLTSLQLFSVSANHNGSINRGQVGYKRITGPIGARLIAEAHGRSQRVELVFSSFGFDRNAALFGVSKPPALDPHQLRVPLDTVDPATGHVELGRTVQGLLTLVSRLGLDGINIDVEQISPSSYDGFSLFVTKLREGLDALDPRLRLSAATMANRSGANLARVALGAGADRVFMMGYDFHWSGSDPGGSSPIARLDDGATLGSAMATYAAVGIDPNRILLGLPLYGMAWPVATPDRYAPRTGAGAVWLPSKHVAELTAPGFVPHTDPLEVAEYLSEEVPPTSADPLGTTTWRAIFYDSPDTLRAKLALARAGGYAGGGFWALGYEKGLPGYIELMADFLAGRVAPTPPPAPDAIAAHAWRPASCGTRC